MELLVKTVIKFMLVKLAENCMKDLPNTEPQLGIDNHARSQTILTIYVLIWICMKDLPNTEPQLGIDNHARSQTILTIYVLIWIISKLHH